MNKTNKQTNIYHFLVESYLMYCQEVYELGFIMLKQLLGSEEFYGKGIPMVFMTDDSSAEISILQKVFLTSEHFSCTFHVFRAMWHWLYTYITKEKIKIGEP